MARSLGCIPLVAKYFPSGLIAILWTPDDWPCFIGELLLERVGTYVRNDKTNILINNYIQLYINNIIYSGDLLNNRYSRVVSHKPL